MEKGFTSRTFPFYSCFLVYVEVNLWANSPHLTLPLFVRLPFFYFLHTPSLSTFFPNPFLLLCFELMVILQCLGAFPVKAKPLPL